MASEKELKTFLLVLAGGGGRVFAKEESERAVRNAIYDGLVIEADDGAGNTININMAQVVWFQEI